MKALRIDSAGVALRDVDTPDAAPGHAGEAMAVLRVSLAGVCNTDLEIAKGYMGFAGTLGHEFVGEVVEGPREWLGTRAVAEINYACGRCVRCEQGLGRHCDDRRVMGIQGADGAFAERIAVPVANLHRVPAGLADEAAVFSEPLAAAFEILEQIDLAEGEPCIVFGDGKLGGLVAQVLHAAGARVTCVGRHEAKLAALEVRGIRSLTLDRWRAEAAAPVDLVVEATGRPDGLALALDATRPRGRLVLKSTIADPAAVDLSPLVIHEMQLIGSRCGPFAPALEALETRRVDVSSLVDARVPLSRAHEALELAGRRGAQKVLIENDGQDA